MFGRTNPAFWLPFATTLWFSQCCVFGENAGTGVELAVERIGSMSEPLTDDELKWLVSASGDLRPLPRRHLVPTPKLTVGEIASGKLSSLKQAERTNKLILDFVCENELSVEHFSNLLQAVRFSLFADLDASQLSSFAKASGNRFCVVLLHRLASEAHGLDDKFDLLIEDQLNGDDVHQVAAACNAILNRKHRVLSWNSRLVALCRKHIDGSLHISPDFVVQTDLRTVVIRTLRKNGFPSTEVRQLFADWSPDPDSELFWQVKATKFHLLSDNECLSELLDALSSSRHRNIVAKVLSENVAIPRKDIHVVLREALAGRDLATKRLSSVIVKQFSPDDFADNDLTLLRERLSGTALERFDFWVTLKSKETDKSDETDINSKKPTGEPE